MKMEKMDGPENFLQRSNRKVSEAFLQQARARWELDDPDGALNELRLAITCDPGHPEIFALRGMILARKGMTHAARRNIHHALKLGGSGWAYAGLVGECLKRIVAPAA